jgi:DNA-binding MarR family transcriptional regulator
LSQKTTHTEYIILENIYDTAGQQEPLRQRDLAQMAGASLGMTNSILKSLAQKGWITIKKLNSRNIQYAVTLDGVNEIIHRSYRYFKRTIKNVVYFRDALENVVYKAKQKDIKTVILVGTSDLDFIVEHACDRLDMNFMKLSNKNTAAEMPQSLIIYAEGIPEDKPGPHGPVVTADQDSFYLSRLIIKQAARTDLGIIRRN